MREIKLRLPRAVHARIKAKAQAEGRFMNRVIVNEIEQAIGRIENPPPSLEQLVARLEHTARGFKALLARMPS